ncbi:MAG: DUF2721 domain-containing protein [Gammaproteobacteria bacterium]|jgi:hypothetical protein|nr:DUF2721 domain-containing protein [Gammaproteobacteria bacterium]
METSITTLAAIIEIAVAPVFLLAGIAGFLNVMSGRLGRIVDRGRVLENEIIALENGEEKKLTQNEFETIRRRSKLINWSIAMCTASGLMVCFVVVSLFIGDYWDFEITSLIISLFVLAMIWLILALLLFLVEVQLATNNMLRPSD